MGVQVRPSLPEDAQRVTALKSRLRWGRMLGLCSHVGAPLPHYICPPSDHYPSFDSLTAHCSLFIVPTSQSAYPFIPVPAPSWHAFPPAPLQAGTPCRSGQIMPPSITNHHHPGAHLSLLAKISGCS